MAEDNQLSSKRDCLQKKIGRLPVLLIETFQNWGRTQKMRVISVKPKTVEDVTNIVKAMNEYNKEKHDNMISLRCVGDGHSWSPLFPDDGNILMYTSQLKLADDRIKLDEPSIDLSHPLTVTIAPGVTTGELSKFFTENNVCFKTDVILDKVTYGGVIAPGCHGVGKDQKAVSDYVKGMSIVRANGKETTYVFPTEKGADFDNALKCNMGLFGVMTGITMEVQPMVIVEVVNDFSYTVKDLFYNPKELEKLYDDNWSLEIFWFPFNSLSWCQVFFLNYFPSWVPFIWEPKHDMLWVRKIKPVDVPSNSTPNQVEYDIKAAQDLISTGFGRLVAPALKKSPKLIPSFLKAGFEMVQKFNKQIRHETINKAIHYQNFIEVMPVLDMEFAFNANKGTFAEQVKAIQQVVEITENYFNKSEREFPLSVAMEMRWMAHSDCLICPAHAVHETEEKEKATLYLEVLSLAGQENWKTYTEDIADKWMKMKINGKAPLPHWAKQWSYLNDIDTYIKKEYGENLTKFCQQVPTEEKLLFSNETLNRAIFQDATKQEKPRVKQSRPSNAETKPEKTTKPEITETMMKDLEPHVHAWKTFFTILGEQMWNFPFKVSTMNIVNQWKEIEAVLHEVNKKYPHLSIEEELFKDLFQ